MDKNKQNLLIGGTLTFIGVFYLLSNLDIIRFNAEILVALAFLAVGDFLFKKFIETKGVGWLIAASIASFVGVVILLESLPYFDDNYIGTLVLWWIAALFAYGFFRNTEKWGFLIPAGIFFTIGGMVVLETLHFNDDGILGSLFFLGVGLTFGVLYLLRNEKNRLDWAKIPALCLISFSAFIYGVSSHSDFANFLFPILLIGLGVLLVFHATRKGTIDSTSKA
ncbi:hypothetical protein IH879_12260 [candidate division KSB1 bacterium]|nr:hypothetical protein [candidate division KSB1 bacterium]